MKQYRRLYKKSVGDIPKGFEIHHIDGDRENNKIENLLMLPKELHTEYHARKDSLDRYMSCGFEVNIPKHAFRMATPSNQMILSYMEKFQDVLIRCEHWVTYKYHLMGVVPEWVVHQSVWERLDKANG